MRTKFIDKAFSRPKRAEVNSRGKAEAEQVITEIGITLAVLLGLAVLGHVLVLVGGNR